MSGGERVTGAGGRTQVQHGGAMAGHDDSISPSFDGGEDLPPVLLP
jgi:hypothetical protein